MRQRWIWWLASVWCVASCTSGTSPSARPRLRVFNGVADGPPLDVYVYGSRLVVSLPPGMATSYIPIGAGQASVKVVASGDSTGIATASASFIGHRPYSVFLVGTLLDLAISVTTDTAVGLSDSARVRFVNAAASSAPVDVYVRALGDSLPLTPTFAGVAFKGVTPYTSLGAGSLEVVITAAGTRTPMVDDTLAALVSQSVRTVVAVDKSGGGLPISVANLVDAG